MHETNIGEACKICGEKIPEENRMFVKERMIGTEELFEYDLCNSCYTLQIVNPPEDIKCYYADSYYSFLRKGNWPKEVLRRIASKIYCASFSDETLPGIKSICGKMSCALENASGYYGSFWRQIREWAPSKNVKILDVGCGSGTMIRDLANQGYTSVLGVDPNIEKDILYKNGAEVRKCLLDEVNGSFDLIMLHHSLEHMNNPIEIINAIKDRLSQSGVCIIRTPVIPCEAFKRYRENWYQIDAPRHYYIFSPESMRRMVESAGMHIIETYYDSHIGQFINSEKYLRGYNLYEQLDIYKALGRKKVKEFRSLVDNLNKSANGDQAIFIIQVHENLEKD